VSDKLVFRSGEYINHYIDDVLEHDPAYIVEKFATNPEMGITETQYNEARRLVDEWDGNNQPGEEWFWIEQARINFPGSYDE
jgi:hypothetical protein